MAIPSSSALRDATKAENLLLELQQLATLPETPGSLDTQLQQLATAAARLLGADRCTFVWLHEEHTTPDTDAALGNASAPLAIHEAAIFKRVVVENRPGSAQGMPASWRVAANESMEVASGNALSAPVRGSGRLIGVVHVSRPHDRPRFDHEDVWLLNVVTVYIGKALQAVQLQNILHSRFAQIALAQSVDDTVGKMLATVPHPGRLVKILARSFYGEMMKAGFGANEIINAASQIISELSASLKRHAKRHQDGLAERSSDGDKRASKRLLTTAHALAAAAT